ncbi:MAG: beta-lactamase family protein [Firmicutes bacterium]|nr:beta-lactamase family protein [Bacillota bacterium]
MKNKIFFNSKISKVIFAAFIAFALVAVSLVAFSFPATAAQSPTIGLSTRDSINSLVEQTAIAQRVPGISVAVISENETLFAQTGYADIRTNTKVDENTLYMLGSVSKAFTGLGVLYLEHEGKLNLTDPVNKHIPWLSFNFDEHFSMNDFRIIDLLHHTSGLTLSSHSLTLPPSSGDDALLETVKLLNGSRLDFAPSTRHGYASANYILSGFLIQEISGMPYEEFMTANIFRPLGLNNTFTSANDANQSEEGFMATGYKPGWFSSRPFVSPEFRGHTPTGYIISNANDIANWLNFQLDPTDAPAPFNELN